MNRIDHYLLYIISTVLFFGMIVTIISNTNQLDLAIILVILIVGLLFYNELFIVIRQGHLKTFFLFLFLAYFFLTIMMHTLNNNSVKIFLYIIIYQLIRKLSWIYSMSISIVFVSYYLIIQVNRISSISDQIKFLAYESSLVLLVVTIVLLVFYILNQNKQLEKAQDEIAFKNTELELAHQNLLKTYHKLETYTIMQERSKIAKQMHDTVGHNLTTALVELELGKILASKDDIEVTSKISGGMELVRKGLADLRLSVKALNEDMNYLEEIKEMIENTKTHTGVSIKTAIDKLDQLDNKVLACIYRLCQEGITNGMKHGKATAFVFIVKIEDNQISVMLQDNGKGFTVLNKGFGLNAMEERVKELGGHIQIESEKMNGVTIRAYLPYRKVVS